MIRIPLFESIISSDTVCNVEKDKDTFFGYKTKECGKLTDAFSAGDKFIIDFKDHYTGYLSFRMDRICECIDAPVRLKLKFAEVPYELQYDFSSYSGALCKSWFQEEIINVDFCGKFTLGRRYSFRYLEVEIIASPRKIKLHDFEIRALTSADISNFSPLPGSTDKDLLKIDKICAKTLSECMQNVYEDGPKRDRRLWTGDLRLQALTDYYVYKNHDLVKKCLFLFAECEEDGKFLPGCLFMTPDLAYDDTCGLTDYALLYAVTLCEYYEYAKDKDTAEKLFPVAKRQLEKALSLLDENNVISLPDGWSCFIDWAENLKLTVPAQGVLLYTLEKMAHLADSLGENKLSLSWKEKLEFLREASKREFFKNKKYFTCEKDENSYSVQAQVWMILGGVVDEKEAESILNEALSSPNSIKPVTPYMHHYVTEAFIKIQNTEKALDYIKNYWGEMVKDADTCYEVFVPSDCTVSPYGDHVINSFCHAWSCSASYFIRKYFVKF